MDNKKEFTVLDLMTIICNNGFMVHPKYDGLFTIFNFSSGTVVDDVDLMDLADTCNMVMQAYHEQGNMISKQETISLVMKLFEEFVRKSKR